MKKFLLCVLILTIAIGLASAPASAQQNKKAWTLMLYFVPDEKIENSLIGNINDIAKVGSGADLNIVLMFDYASSKPTTYYYVDRGGTKKIKELGETNMGSPQTFYDFIKYSMTNYPAERYALIINSHGSGWESYYGGGSVATGVQLDSDINISPAYKPVDFSGTDLSGLNTAIAYDDDPSDCLTLKELKKSLTMAAKNFNGSKKIDMFIADACLFAMIEAAYELRDAATVLMGSESTIPGTGLDYRSIASELTKNPKTDALQLSKTIAKNFTSSSYGDNILVGVNTAAIEPLAVAFSELASKILKVGGKRSFSGVSKIGDVDKYSDISNIADSILKKEISFANDPAYPEIANQAKIVKEKLNESLSAFSASGSFRSGFGGISVYWPDKTRYPKYKAFYKALDFSNKFQWDEFLDSQLLGLSPQAGAVRSGSSSLVSELDGAFFSIRHNSQLNEKTSAANESAKIEHLKKTIVDNTVTAHKTGNYKAVHETLRDIRNAKSIDTATKNKMINDLKQGVGPSGK
jgi:hypothetical protein